MEQRLFRPYSTTYLVQKNTTHLFGEGLPFLYLDEVLLWMRADLKHGARSDEAPSYSRPILSAHTKSNKENCRALLSSTARFRRLMFGKGVECGLR